MYRPGNSLSTSGLSKSIPGTDSRGAEWVAGVRRLCAVALPDHLNLNDTDTGALISDPHESVQGQSPWLIKPGRGEGDEDSVGFSRPPALAQDAAEGVEDRAGGPNGTAPEEYNTASTTSSTSTSTSTGISTSTGTGPTGQRALASSV
ncbi:1,3-beta-glucan synthase component GSC2 [Frankliniella fusca]|uniref:1,3-beta-glucan synthase component GSC2 n=1 Tax=Frankliniella fusca TaxID=407009 RepID=A0AAE1HQ36_9NEOP|nr:1,3-beta-glucan synthase component GSC2 [Frankliniella fusca]